MMRRRMVIAFLAPALALYLGFLVLPAIQAFYLSFYKTSGFGSEPAVVVGNSIDLLRRVCLTLSATARAWRICPDGLVLRIRHPLRCAMAFS